MESRNISRENETEEVFKSILSYLNVIKRSRSKERINIHFDAVKIFPELKILRNSLIIPASRKKDIGRFIYYSECMIQAFSVGALRDNIVRLFLESSQFASGKARGDVYNKLRFFLLPKSQSANSFMAIARDTYAPKYDSYYR